MLFIFLLGVTPMAHSSHIVLDCPLGRDLTQQSLRHVPNQQSINVLPHFISAFRLSGGEALIGLPPLVYFPGYEEPSAEEV